MPESLREEGLSSEQVYSGKLLDVWRDKVRLPNGQTSVREYIKHPGAVLMVPVFNRDRILFIRQFRYPVGEVFVELPAGKLDPGETPEATARRELAEETGYGCGQLTRLGLIHPCIGYSNEQIVIYLATDLMPERANLEHDEFVQPFEMGLDEALDWIDEGKITDVKTIIALYWTERYLRITVPA